MNTKVLLHAVGGLLLSVLIIFGLVSIASFIPNYSFAVYVIAWALIVFIAYIGTSKFKSSEGENGIIVYTDYYDIFKCFSVPVVAYILIYLGSLFQQFHAGLICAVIYAVLMTSYICYESAKINKFWDLPVVFLTKFSLSIIWVIALIQIFNPAGRNAATRRESRTIGVLIIMVLTPLMNAFVLNNDGKDLILNKFRGRRGF